MKKAILALGFLVWMCSSSFAQSVQMIPWQDGSGNFLVNSIIDYMVADTNASGQQLHDIYKLEAGGSYLLDQTVNINNPIILTSDPHDRTDANAAPPVVRIVTDGSGNPSTGLFFLAFADFTVENIYFAGMGTGDVWMNGNWLSVGAPDITIKADACIFDYMGWSIITNFAHLGVSYIAENVYIKNNINAGDPYSPFWVLTNQPVNQFIARNCTYFQSHGMFMQARVPIDYVEIDHCTFVNNLKMQIFNENLTNAKITNNLFYNTLAIGENEAENADKDRDGLPWSIITVDTLPGNEPGGSNPIMPEANRNLIIKNNVWHRTPAVEQFHLDNNLIVGPFMNSRTQAMFDNNTDWPGFDESGNTNEAISFTNFPDFSVATDSMFAYMEAIRNGVGGLFIWGFESDRAEWPDLFRVNVEWPLVEDFEHNASITGTDGHPIGDRNWYGPVSIDDDISAQVAKEFELSQNYPNPFNPSTTIKYELGKVETVNLSIYDVSGQLVRTLVNNARQSAGSFSVIWDGKSDIGSVMPSGVYFYRLQTETASMARKMVMIK